MTMTDFAEKKEPIGKANSSKGKESKCGSFELSQEDQNKARLMYNYLTRKKKYVSTGVYGVDLVFTNGMVNWKAIVDQIILPKGTVFLLKKMVNDADVSIYRDLFFNHIDDFEKSKEISIFMRSFEFATTFNAFCDKYISGSDVLNPATVKMFSRIKCDLDLLKTVMDIALSNNMGIFGSATIMDMSGIPANDLDITSGPVSFERFCKYLKQFCKVIDNSKNTAVRERYGSSHKKLTVKFGKFKMGIDYASNTAFDDIALDFTTTSLLLSRNNGRETLVVRKNGISLMDCCKDACNRVLRYALADNDTMCKQLYTRIKVLKRSLQKQEAGWTVSTGFPMKTCVSYRMTRNECASILPFPIDISLLIFELTGDNFSDNYKKDLCKVSQCNSSQTDICKDFVFVTPCCNATKCIPCAMKDLEMSGDIGSDDPISAYMCQHCITHRTQKWSDVARNRYVDGRLRNRNRYPDYMG